MSKKAKQQESQMTGLEVSFPPLMLHSMKRAWVSSVRLSTGASTGSEPRGAVAGAAVAQGDTLVMGSDNTDGQEAAGGRQRKTSRGCV